MGRRGQRGVVLIVVLWVIALLTVLLAAFVATVKVERQSVADVSASIQARAVTEGVLNYLAALHAVSAPELAEMPGQRYELMLNELGVSFRIVPETVFIPINTLSADVLAGVFAAVDMDDALELAEQIVELRGEWMDEATGEMRPPLRFQSLMHLTHVLGTELQQLRPYERWFSFYGSHEQVTPGYVPQEVLELFGLAAAETEMETGLEAEAEPEFLWDASAVYRVQVQIPGRLRPRQVEAIASFHGSEYRLLQLNEYNVEFSFNEVGE